jgi:hypothetical protein
MTNTHSKVYVISVRDVRVHVHTHIHIHTTCSLPSRLSILMTTTSPSIALLTWPAPCIYTAIRSCSCVYMCISITKARADSKQVCSTHAWISTVSTVTAATHRHLYRTEQDIVVCNDCSSACVCAHTHGASQLPAATALLLSSEEHVNLCTESALYTITNIDIYYIYSVYIIKLPVLV